jgi:large subunit ribosomal protein L18Ae
MRQFQVIGRKAPTDAEPNPPAYRMKLFATSSTVAESRFWYFIHAVRKMKKTTGEILDVNEVRHVYLSYITSANKLWLNWRGNGR